MDIYIGKMIDLSTKKHSLLQDMLALTQAQSKTITEDGIGDLKRLIAEKQARIEEINKLDEEFGACFHKLKQELGVESLDEIKSTDIPGIRDLQDIVGRIMELLKEISRIETKNNENAKKLLDDLSSKIKMINQGKTANTAYGKLSAMPPPSYFVDSKK